MRQLIVSTPVSEAAGVRDAAQEFEAKHCFELDSTVGEDKRTTLFLHLNNREVEPFLQRLEGTEADVTLHPRPIVTVHTPFEEIPDDLRDTQMRSPFEVFQEGIQSIGAVQGLLGYAILGGIVVWVGLYTNAVSLLVAAMLIAPFAGPAMNFALGTARGDTRLMGRSFLRYVGSVLATVLTALLISLAMGPQEATQAMMNHSKISEIVVFLPLVAGAAGALNLIQSQRDSLVSGAAVGVLVAAALAPPAGNLGMFIALGQKLPALNCLFILVLQLVAINLSGALVFRWHGVNAEQALYQRGKSWISNMALLGSVLALAGLLYLQLQDTPSLRRSSLEQQFSARITQNLKDSDLVYPLEAQVDFLPTKKRFEHTILLQVKCLKLTDEPDSEIEPLVKEMIRASVQQQLPDSDPLISLELIKRG